MRQGAVVNKRGGKHMTKLLAFESISTGLDWTTSLQRNGSSGRQSLKNTWGTSGVQMAIRR
jgi:hypothetical protein